MQKNKIRNILFGTIILYSLCFFNSCISKPRNAASEDDVIAYQRRITEIETELRNLNESIKLSNERFRSDLSELGEEIRRLEDIRAESAAITDSVDRVIYLFEHYESVIERIIRDYYEIRSRVEAYEESASNFN